MKQLTKEDLKKLIEFQRFEKTEHIFYKLLSKRVKGENRGVLEKISFEELKHYNIIKKYTNQELKEKKFFIFVNLLFSFILGITFSIKFMENGEKRAQKNYENLIKNLPKEDKEVFFKNFKRRE